MLHCCVCRRRLPVTLCIMAKRCVLKQKLLLTAYRKWYMRNRLVPNEWPWPWGRIKPSRSCQPCQPLRYIWRWIFRKPLEIAAWFQRTTNRKWHMGYRMVTWPMTSSYLERSNSWPQYAYRAISWKRLDWLHSKGPPIRNDIWSIKWSHDRWRHMTPKSAVRQYGRLS